jgi:hypothetical protein
MTAVIAAGSPTWSNGLEFESGVREVGGVWCRQGVGRVRDLPSVKELWTA